MSRGAINVVAGSLVAVGVGGYIWSPSVVWVVVGFLGVALKINEWINGPKR